jgi:type VI secretion system secreted protein Hcp
MAIHAYLTLKGEKSGDIKGSCDQEHHKGKILVYAFDHVVSVPTDPHGGHVTGRRVHEPWKVVKGLDSSTPLLYQALVHGESIEALLEWYRIRGGEEELYFTMKLENAQVIRVAPYMKLVLDPAFAQYEHLEEVSFTYQKIIWTYKPDGIEADDYWKKPNVKK